jgi:hypothetical protein
MLEGQPDEPNLEGTDKVRQDLNRETNTQLRTTIGKVVQGPLAIERFRLLVARTLGQSKKDDCQ